MNKSILFSAFLVCSFYNFAQNFSYGWHSSNNSIESNESIDSKVYHDTLYVLSQFYGDSLDANPGTPVDLILASGQNNTSRVYYITSYTLDGSYISSKKLLESAVSYVDVSDFEIDQNGQLILLGYANVDLSVYDLDFNPLAATAGSYSLSTNGTISFIAFYENTGNYVGHIEYVVDAINSAHFNDAAVTNQNELVVVGDLFGTIDLDFTGATDQHTSAGDYDVFLLKINLDNSTYQWGKQFGGTAYSSGVLIETRNNRIALLGEFEDATLDLDPSAAPFNITNSTGYNNLFISLFDLTGTFINGIGLGGSNDDLSLWGLSMDADDNVYLQGIMYQGNTLDLNPAFGTAMVPNTHSYNTFLAKYNINLGLSWSRYLLSDEDIDYNAAYNRSSIFTNNSFVAMAIEIGSGPIILSDGTNTDTLTNNSEYGLFIGAFNRFNGDLLNHAVLVADNANGSFIDVEHLTCDAYNNVYVNGYFQKSVDFNQFDASANFDTSFLYSVNYYEYSPYTLKLDWTSAAGLDEMVPDVSATAYPNPSTGNVYLKANGEIKHITVVQADGTLVEITSAVINGNEAFIDLSQLKQGLYLINIQTGAGIVTKTVIKS